MPPAAERAAAFCWRHKFRVFRTKNERLQQLRGHEGYLCRLATFLLTARRGAPRRSD